METKMEGFLQVPPSSPSPSIPHHHPDPQCIIIHTLYE